jgi:molybdenum cofactor cytidylyltransferase
MGRRAWAQPRFHHSKRHNAKFFEVRQVIAGVILAAGESSRMGRDKALLAYRGRTFLESIAAALREAGVARICIVLGHHAEEIRRATDVPGAEFVINKDYALGQTSSLQAGLQALQASDLEAVVLCLVDHPAVRAATMGKLIAAFRDSGGPVVIPKCQSQRGHPVLIARRLFDEILELGPANGANAVLRRHRSETRFVVTDDRGILLDVDNEEAYRRIPR